MQNKSLAENENHEEILPNGYLRQNYHEQGFSDEDIEFWCIVLQC